MEVVRHTTLSYVQEQVVAMQPEKDASSLFFGPHVAGCIMGATRSKPFTTIMRGHNFVALPGATVVNFREADEVKALLGYRTWKEVVFAEALAKDGNEEHPFDLITLLREMNASQPDTPVIVVTVGACNRVRSLSAHLERSAVKGNSTWGLVKEARREMPSLRISLFDIDPAVEISQIAACRQADGKDYVCFQGSWVPCNRLQLSMDVPRPLVFQADDSDSDGEAELQRSLLDALFMEGVCRNVFGKGTLSSPCVDDLTQVTVSCT